VGFALLGFYRANSHYLPANGSVDEGGDSLFPYFVANFLPPGVGGIVLAGLFAAAMSSLSSGINSVSGVLLNDLIPMRWRAIFGVGRDIVAAKALALGVGIAVISLSFFFRWVPGNFLEQASKTFGLFVAPLAGIFILAMFFPFATATGAILGAVAAFLAGVVFAYWDRFTGQRALSFQWITLVSRMVHLIIGSLTSFLWPDPGSGRERECFAAPDILS